MGCGGSGGSTQAPSTDATLSALGLSSGTLTPAFDPGTLAYTVALPFLQLTASVTPSAADAGATITVNGVAVVSGAVSADLPLAAGPNPVLIVVTAADTTTTQSYTVVFTRAAGLTQAPYRKASNAEGGDQFGYSVALSGDTLVVGTFLEASSATGGEADNTAPIAGGPMSS